MGNLVGPIIGGLLGAGGSMIGTGMAVKAQTDATNKSIKAQREMFDIARKTLEPFVGAGASAIPNLTGAMIDPYFTKPIDLSPAGLEATPGYQFIRDQGLKSVHAGYAARGLGSSGAAMKGAAQFATGLADTRFKDIFEVESAQRSNLFKRFYDLAALGSNAGAGVATAATAAGQGIGQSFTGQGNAQAAAYTSAGSTVNNMMTQLGGYAYMRPYMNKMYAGG